MSGEHYDDTRALFRRSAVEKDGYYDSGRESGHNPWQQWVRRTAHELVHELGQRNPTLSSACDLGCGRGDFTMALAERCPFLTEVRGCDFVEEVVAIANRMADGHAHIGFDRGDLRDLPYADRQFDVALCTNALHHVHDADRPRALGELARIAGKHLLLEIKNADSIYFRYVHPRTVDGVSVFPASVHEVQRTLAEHGFALASRRWIFGLNRLSPLVVLGFERR